jgi:hypothetical protein
MTLAGTLLFVVPGILSAICHALYAPVAVMEDAGVRATLKRARGLARRYWSTVVIITLLQFSFPILVWIASVDSSFELTLGNDWTPKTFGFGFNLGGKSSLYQLLNLLVAR